MVSHVSKDGRCLHLARIIGNGVSVLQAMKGLMRRFELRGLAIVTALVMVSLIFFYVSGNRDSGIQGAFIHRFGDAMEWKSRWISGRNAIDCGIVPVRGDSQAATDCALRAFSSRKAFRIRYGLQTMDTVMAVGVVSSSNGQLYEILFSGGAPTGTIDVFRQRFFMNACATQASLRKTPKGRVSCFPASPDNRVSSWLSDAP